MFQYILFQKENLKKILLFLLTFSLLIFSNTGMAFAAVHEMGWTTEINSIWSRMKAEHDPVYINYKSHADRRACTYDNYGLNYAIMYKVEGNPEYCADAFQSNGGCLPGANRNKTRDCFVERALAYSLCGNALSAHDKDAWAYQLNAITSLVSNTAHGTRSWDTDELMGHYFGCMIYDLAQNGKIDQCMANASSNGSPFFGGVDATDTGCYGSKGTLRNCIKMYFEKYGDGDFIEGTEYNKNTLWYTLLGVHAINSFYGEDKFPEITKNFGAFADNYYQRTTPGYGQHYQWGDIKGGLERKHSPDRSQPLYAAVAFLANNDANMWALYDATDTDGCVNESYGLFLNPYAERKQASGQTSSNAAGTGQAFWHSGWKTSDTFFASQNRREFFADHSWNILENFEVGRKRGWITTAKKHYYSNEYDEHPYSNGLLVFGGFSGFREAKGQTAYEAGQNYMYHAGVTSGFFQRDHTAYQFPPFVNESSNQKLFRHNTDGTDTVFLYNRVKACRPDSTTCMTPAQAKQLHKRTRVNYDRALAEESRHIYVLNMEAVPSKDGDKFSWTAGTGDLVELYTFMKDYDFETVNMATVNYFTAPYYFMGSLINAEKRGYQLRLKIPTEGDYTLYPVLSVLHMGGAGQYTEITDNGGAEKVEGAMVETSSERVVALFDAQDDTKTKFTSHLKGKGEAIYDPDRFAKAASMSRFKKGSIVEFTTDDGKNIEVFIVGLDPQRTWTVMANGAPAGCEVSSAGVCHFTMLGAADTHTVFWSAAGKTRDDSPEKDGDGVWESFRKWLSSFEA